MKPTDLSDSPATSKIATPAVSKSAAPSSSKPTPAVDTSFPPRTNRRGSTQAPKHSISEPVAALTSPDALKAPVVNGFPSNRQSRRRRTKPGSVSAPTPKPGPSADVLARPPNSPPAEPAPVTTVQSALLKDAPPHLAMKTDGTTKPPIKDTLRIDSLVEHVRSLAMDRPTTPGTATGSHIDWAGDDDDTLPDLDDWGVKSTTTASGDSHSPHSDKLLSPLLDDSLKQLPLHGKSPNLTHPTLLPSRSPDMYSDEGIQPVDSAPEVTIIEPPAIETPAVQASTPTTKLPNGPPAAKPASKSNDRVLPIHMTHPLPAKPTLVAPVKPSRNHLSSMPFSSLTPAKGTQDVAQALEPVSNGSQKEAVKSRSAAKPLRAPGLEASIHAPHNTKSDSALPSPPQTASPFNPAHGRSRTLGRPGFSSEAGFASRPFRSGQATPSHGIAAGPAHHGRTQSTPPPSAGGHARHASRPIITGDAISRLARTLGATPRKELAATSPSPKAATIMSIVTATTITTTSATTTAALINTA
ncbi:hypothetical protein K488DRAFT_84283 [Vararia minispora EC-137]|uniref:Uncharacterized protein n=1 Tax=Vararia minispora EC-137 TaxID=1314806 RepID=A0ACB8QQB6_9AGAM|nr:hypothetical protein K488DRAFT_84283 [Vararia minispora EC-137]